MQFTHSDEQQLIRETARSFLAERADAAQVRAAMLQPGGYDAGLWRAMSAELGWTAVRVRDLTRRVQGTGSRYLRLGHA